MVATATASASDFLFLGEHPAIDFANTCLAPRGQIVDLLRTWGDVTDWLEKADVLKGARLSLPVCAAGKALDRVRNLRCSWHEQISRLTAGGHISESFVKMLNDLLRKQTFHETLAAAGQGGFRIQRSTSSLRGADLALAALAREIARFLVESNMSYLRKCASDECVLHFYDTTKNHRRQWCSTAVCGNRHKVAAFRRRQAKSRKRKQP